MSDEGQTAPGQPSPVKTAGPSYVCALCDTVLPDGAHVLADYTRGKLTGVRADTDPDNPESNSVAHACGSLA